MNTLTNKKNETTQPKIKATDLSVDDLYWIDGFNNYRAIFQYDDIREKADDLFEKTHDLKLVDKFCEEEYDKRNINPLLMNSEIPKKFRDASFDKYKPKNQSQTKALKIAKDYAKNVNSYINDGKNLFFVGFGKIGTGKTYLSVCIAKELIKNEINIKFISSVDMIFAIKEDFKIKKYIDVPVLILDDMGKERGTSWVCEQLYAILNARYLAQKPTIITTEGSLEDLQENYDEKGRALVSRLKENHILAVVTGEDYRTQKSTYHDNYNNY